jgi:hypothetical protein
MKGPEHLLADVILITSDVNHPRTAPVLFFIRTANNLFQNVYKPKYFQKSYITGIFMQLLIRLRKVQENSKI